jgi:hypothetical protein
VFIVLMAQLNLAIFCITPPMPNFFANFDVVIAKPEAVSKW